MRLFQRFVLAALIAPFLAPVSSLAQDVLPNHIQKGNITVNLTPIATGLTSPVDLVPAPDNSGRLFVVDQIGQIRIIQNNVLQTTPYLDISSRLVPLTAGYDERGLLGLTFDPNFATNGRLFTYQSEPNNGAADFTVPAGTATPPLLYQNVLSGWHVSSNPNVVDPTTFQSIMKVDKPQTNHNGGTIGFGPDGKLYIGFGDGGAANDSGVGHNVAVGNGQDLTTVLGKMLRIDVNVAPGAGNSANGQYNIPADNPFVNQSGAIKEIYAQGLRNPYRFSVDSATGHIIVGDVGQNTVEEVDQITAGANYGWPYKEGSFKFIRTGTGAGTVSTDLTGLPGGLTDPLLQYDHVDGTAVIAGYVYHGSLIPQLQGKYVFGDLSQVAGSAAGRLFYADLTTGQINEFHLGLADLPLGLYIKGFGQDNNGELYVLTSSNVGPSGNTGAVYAITPEPAGLIFLVLLLPLFQRHRSRTFRQTLVTLG